MCWRGFVSRRCAVWRGGVLRRGARRALCVVRWCVAAWCDMGWCVVLCSGALFRVVVACCCCVMAWCVVARCHLLRDAARCVVLC